MERIEEYLYSNIGKKLKILAVVLGVACLVIMVISLLSLLSSADSYSSPIIAITGLVSGITGIISTWPLYAFGQLVEDVRIIKEKQLGDIDPKFKSSFMKEELPDL